MSRSKRQPRIPIARSVHRSKATKEWRSKYNRAMRRGDKMVIPKCNSEEEFDSYANRTIVKKDQISSEWESPRDGKIWWRENPKAYRK